jgi:hypothetical protein
MKLLGIFRADFNVTDQPLIIYCIFINTTGKMEIQCSSTSALLYFKKVHDSVRREALYDIFTAFGRPMKLDWRINMSLN